jgi:hypothetical protein
MMARRAHGLADDRGKLAGGGDRTGFAGARDGPCDPAGEALFAVLEDDVGQGRLVHRLEQGRCRQAAVAVHAHVERRVGAKAEAPRRIVELHGGDAEVGEDAAVDMCQTARVQDVREGAVVAVNELDPIAMGRQRVGGQRQRRPITVEPEHARRAGLEQGTGVPACSEGTVHEQPPACGCQLADDLRDKYRCVHDALRSPGRRGRSDGRR